MENLARGSMSEKPTAVSIYFSKEMMQMIKIEGCLTDNDKAIDIKVLRQRIQKDKTINIEVFNQLLSQNCEFKVESKLYMSEDLCREEDQRKSYKGQHKCEDFESWKIILKL